MTRETRDRLRDALSTLIQNGTSVEQLDYELTRFFADDAPRLLNNGMRRLWTDFLDLRSMYVYGWEAEYDRRYPGARWAESAAISERQRQRLREEGRI